MLLAYWAAYVTCLLGRLRYLPSIGPPTLLAYWAAYVYMSIWIFELEMVRVRPWAAAQTQVG